MRFSMTGAATRALRTCATAKPAASAPSAMAASSGAARRRQRQPSITAEAKPATPSQAGGSLSRLK